MSLTDPQTQSKNNLHPGCSQTLQAILARLQKGCIAGREVIRSDVKAACSFAEHDDMPHQGLDVVHILVVICVIVGFHVEASEGLELVRRSG